MRIPDHAAINETVSATGELNKRWARGLSNAVLRNYRRREAELLQNLQLADLLNVSPTLAGWFPP